jgi:hypothetical protein
MYLSMESNAFLKSIKVMNSWMALLYAPFMMRRRIRICWIHRRPVHVPWTIIVTVQWNFFVSGLWTVMVTVPWIHVVTVPWIFIVTATWTAIVTVPWILTMNVLWTVLVTVSWNFIVTLPDPNPDRTVDLGRNHAVGVLLGLT